MGGLVAPLVALRESALRALVLMAAPAWTDRRIMEHQNANSARAEFAGAAYDSVMRAAMEAVDSLAAGGPWTGFFARHDPHAVARRLASAGAHGSLLLSGWIRGEDKLTRKAAAVAATYGSGRIVLLGFRAQHRAQTNGAFPCVFNALYWSVAKD
jgi:hypothetical protein